MIMGRCKDCWINHGWNDIFPCGQKVRLRHKIKYGLFGSIFGNTVPKEK